MIHLRFSPSILLLIIIFAFESPAQEKTALQLISDGVRSAQIDRFSELRLKQYLARGQMDSLPEPYRSTRPDKCGFGLNLELYPHANSTFGKNRFQSTVDSVLYSHSFTSFAGPRTFNIFYYPSGPSQVPPLDENSNGIPDWVERTGEYLEQAYRLQVDSLGYREPPTFVRTGGSMNILITNLHFLYGETIPLEEYPPGSGAFTSSIRLENDFVGGFYTHGYEALQVTVAHEFFHCIQLAYVFRLSDLWYYELSSTWMEDVLYDHVNDYYGYIGTFFSSPSRPLSATSGYEAAHWNHFIEKRYGRSVIKASWEGLQFKPALDAINEALLATEDTSNGLRRAFQQFAIWNYFTGYRADSIQYYPEGSQYPMVRPPLSSLADGFIADQQPPLSASYCRRYVTDSTYLSLDLHPTGALELSTILERPQATKIVSEWLNSPTVLLTDVRPADTIWIIIVHSNWNTSSLNFEIELDIRDGSTSGPVLSNLKVFPNPLRADLRDFLQFSFLVRQSQSVTLNIYALSGKKVHTQTIANMAAGYYSPGLQWDGKDLNGDQVSSGTYVYRVEAGGLTKTGKIAIVR